MDRRQFLKNSILSAGAVTVGATQTAEAKSIKVKTGLEVKDYVTEPKKQIPVVDSADVVIVGGGPAGFAASVAAARQGVSVLVLERQYFLGGLFTGCGVTPIIDMYSPKKDGKEQAIKGICEELCNRLEEKHMISWDRIIPKADPEAAKFLMEDMMDQAGVRLLYGVQAAEVVLSGNRISAVILEGKSGRVAVRTNFVIDCSGDGDVMQFCGEDFNTYKDDIGAMWRIGNAENSNAGSATAVKGVKTRWALGEKAQDGLDMYNLTRIQLKLRRMMWEESENLRKEEGCQDLFLLDTPSVVGVRITRVLNSVCNVTVEGAINGKKYDDVIGFTGSDSNIEFNGKVHKSINRKIWQVPYSALTPKHTENLLVAGRCFGFERGLTFDSREVGTCFMTGQAAGTAAGIAVQSRCSCRDLDIHKLQSALRAQNVKLDW